MGTIIVIVENGVAAAADPAHDDVSIIDLDREQWDYDDVRGEIRGILDSDLDGPQQMDLIQRVATACLKDWA